LLVLLLLSENLSPAPPAAAAAEGVLLALLPEGHARLVQSAMIRTRPTSRCRSLRAARKPWMHNTCQARSRGQQQQQSAGRLSICARLAFFACIA
jgi:hypothetical protein